MLQLIVENGAGGYDTIGTMTSLPVIPFLVASAVGILFVSIGIYKLMRLLYRPELHGLNRQRIEEIWKQIEKTAEQGTMGAKLAVIEADKLLDGVLKSIMMPGETLGERLKTAGYKYPSLRQVWGAHRLRNQLVHDSAFDLTTSQARRALRDYQAALKTLNVM